MFDTLDVSCEIKGKLQEFTGLLIKWNKHINLISENTVKNIEQRHILDSMQLLNYIEKKDVSILDIGAGGGLPGIVLSICGVKKVTLIESDERKAAFLLQASKISSNPIEVKNSRVESLQGLSSDILVSRAFADLNTIFKACKTINITKKFLLHKGEKYRYEIAEAKKHWLFNILIHDSITSKKGKILEIINLKPYIL